MKALTRPFWYQFLTLPIGVGLLIWLLGRQDWQKIFVQFQAVRYEWIVPVLCATTANYAWRALRWRLFLPAYSFPTVFRALMVGYFVNLALPRVGELVRIWAVGKPLSVWEGLGTVVAERTLDLLCLSVIIAIFLLTHVSFWQFISLPTWAMNVWLFVGVAVLLGFIVWLFFRYVHHWGGWRDFQHGLGMLWVLRRQGWLWVYTLLIWWSYTAMSYYWFFALPATAHLGWNVAFAMLALGTLSRIVPLQANGAGVYHSLVVLALGSFGIAEAPAFALTLLIHTTQLLFNLIVGAICWVWWSSEGVNEWRRRVER
jgi:uncharacterized membrane protein YbhN (UPF0104 family)